MVAQLRERIETGQMVVVRTAKVHAKITWGDTTEEARLTCRRGVVRTLTR